MSLLARSRVFRGFLSSKPQTFMPRYRNEDTRTCIILLKQGSRYYNGAMNNKGVGQAVFITTCRDIEIRSILYIVNKDTDQAVQMCRLSKSVPLLFTYFLLGHD